MRFEELKYITKKLGISRIRSFSDYWCRFRFHGNIWEIDENNNENWVLYREVSAEHRYVYSRKSTLEELLDELLVLKVMES